MSSKDPKPFLRDIRRACAKVLRYAEGKDFGAVRDDERTFDAILQNLTVIGEAVKNLPDAVRDLSPDVPWRRIARFRDIVVHHYFDVDPFLVWDIVENEISPLLNEIERLLSKLEAAP
jgi:uncharacterized protein with HEPN domain